MSFHPRSCNHIEAQVTLFVDGATGSGSARCREASDETRIKIYRTSMSMKTKFG
eukprot:COSAG06_NODE_67710_length_251_cov_0.677632_1_plen_53_part_01